MVPVHTEDHPLLRMSWEGPLYYDAVLPFGLSCPPMFSTKNFTAIADALQWIVQQAGVPTVLHYLDDFQIILILISVTMNFNFLHVSVAKKALPQC